MYGMETYKQEMQELKQQERAARLVLLDIANKRRELVMRLSNAGMSNASIARVYGLSRERVGQMIKRGTSPALDAED